MGESGIWQIIILIILLIFSAFFSASETAIMSLSKLRVRHLVEEKVKNANIINSLTQNPSKLLGSILVGNNVVNIGASALATALAIDILGNSGVGIATGIMTVLVLIFGEITPKSLAAKNNERISLLVAKPLQYITIILNPIVIVLTHITNFLIQLFGGSITTKDPFITEEELRTIVDVSHEEGVLEFEERKMIHNVFEFSDTQVKEVMTQRTDVAAIEINASYDETIDLVKEEQFSRLPIYEGNSDNMVGILHIKDIFIAENFKENFSIHKYLRKPLYTFEYKQVSELFEEMRKKRISMSIVLDEYGGTAGIVTMEDLVEEIVGEIRDEYDEFEYEIQKLKDNEYLVDGSTKLELINEMKGVFIESKDFDTIGGFITGELGRLPQLGEVIEHEKVQYIVEGLARNRITKIKIMT